MLDIRYIVGSLIATVAIVVIGIRLFGPADTATTSTATLKPRIEPSRVVEQPPAPAAPKQVAAPAKTPAIPSPEVTGSIGERKPAAEPQPAPKRVVKREKKEEPAGFQWPMFRFGGQE